MFEKKIIKNYLKYFKKKKISFHVAYPLETTLQIDGIEQN